MAETMSRIGSTLIFFHLGTFFGSGRNCAKPPETVWFKDCFSADPFLRVTLDLFKGDRLQTLLQNRGLVPGIKLPKRARQTVCSPLTSTMILSPEYQTRASALAAPISDQPKRNFPENGLTKRKRPGRLRANSRKPWVGRLTN